MRLIPIVALLLLAYFSCAQSSTQFQENVVMFKYKSAVKIKADNNLKRLPFQENPIKKIQVEDYPIVRSIVKKYTPVLFERPSYYTNIPELQKIFRVTLNSSSEADRLIEELKLLPEIEHVSKPVIYQTIGFTPNDPDYQEYDKRWYLDLVRASEGWEYYIGKHNATVAVVDNYVADNHEDYELTTKKDVADNKESTSPPLEESENRGYSHGTHVAGLVGMKLNNGKGSASISGGNINLMGIKVSHSQNSKGIDKAYDGVQWACQNGADVVSMSWGAYQKDWWLEIMMNGYGNVVFVGGAGNDSTSNQFFPAAFGNTIAVGSVEYDDTKSGFSNYGDWITVSSPGGRSFGNVFSAVYTHDGEGYSKMWGTSMATPIVASLCGLLKSMNPDLTRDQIRNCIINSGKDVGQNIGPRIDVVEAIKCARALYDAPPVSLLTADTTEICEDDSIQFQDLSDQGGAEITSWKWEFPGGTPSTFEGQTPPAITYETAGVYDVLLITESSIDTDTIIKHNYIHVNPKPLEITISGNTNPQEASEITYSVVREDSVQYEWFLPSDWQGSSDSSSIQTVIGQESGVVKVIATNNCGSRMDSLVVNPELITGIYSSFRVSNFKISPNPTQSFFTVYGKGNLSVFDAFGRLITSDFINNQKQINCADWAKGIYFVTIENEGLIRNKRLVIR